jgi:hypothetical protein
MIPRCQVLALRASLCVAVLLASTMYRRTRNAATVASLLMLFVLCTAAHAASASGGYSATTLGPPVVLSFAGTRPIDGFGLAAAISADGTTIAVGAPDYGNDGRVFVYSRAGQDWTSTTEAAQLNASDGRMEASFGWSVAISPDGSSIVVGDPNANNYRGSIYVYERPAGGWADATENEKIQPPDQFGFGWSLALSADGTTLVGGTVNWDTQPTVHVYTRSTRGGWANDAKLARLVSSDGTARNSFGLRVAVSANGDTVVVGAPEQPRVSGSGKLYVFERPPSGWADATETAMLAPAGSGDADFGWSLDVSGDGATIVAGAPSTYFSRGSAFLFTRPAGGWVTATETASLYRGAETYDHYGREIAISHTGRRVAVGTAGYGVVGVNNGGVYVYDAPAKGWDIFGPAAARLAIIPELSDPSFGGTIAMNSDGSIVVVGASRSNKVFVFGRAPLPPTISSAVPPSARYGATYNYKLTASGVPTPTWHVKDDCLPPGLMLDRTTGVLSGTPTAVGSYPCTLLARNNEAPDAERQVTLVVDPAPLTIRAHDQRMVAGQEVPTLTLSYDGFVGNDDPSVLDVPAQVRALADVTSPPGSYPIVVDGARDANYQLTFITGTLTITALESQPSLVPTTARSGAPGSSFAFLAGGFEPAQQLTVAVNGRPVLTLPADADGQARFAVSFATEAPSGTYTISLTSAVAAIRATGAQRGVETTVTIAPEAPLIAGSADSRMPIVQGLPRIYMPMTMHIPQS